MDGIDWGTVLLRFAVIAAVLGALRMLSDWRGVRDFVGDVSRNPAGCFAALFNLLGGILVVVAALAAIAAMVVGIGALFGIGFNAVR